MNTATINTPMLNDYWNVIKNWNNDMKIELISRISSSMARSAKKVKGKTLGDFFGVIKDDDCFPTAKELSEVMKDDAEDVNKFIL